jgi:hypothetical protein
MITHTVEQERVDKPEEDAAMPHQSPPPAAPPAPPKLFAKATTQVTIPPNFTTSNVRSRSENQFPTTNPKTPTTTTRSISISIIKSFRSFGRCVFTTGIHDHIC